MFVATFTLQISDSSADISLLRLDIGVVRNPILWQLQGVPAELAYREGVQAGFPAAHWALHAPAEGGGVFDRFGRLPESEFDRRGTPFKDTCPGSAGIPSVCAC